MRKLTPVAKMGFPACTVVQHPPFTAGDARNMGSVSGSGGSPVVGNGNPLQYSDLENSRYTEKPCRLHPMGSQRVEHY